MVSKLNNRHTISSIALLLTVTRNICGLEALENKAYKERTSQTSTDKSTVLLAMETKSFRKVIQQIQVNLNWY